VSLVSVRARLLAVLVGLLAAAPAGAQESPPDTLGGWMRSLADSTDRYFGRSAAPVDTAGLDSALAAELAEPRRSRRRRDLSLTPAPWLFFDRADGPLWGASLGIGEPEHAAGRLTPRAGYAVGPNEWRGGARYQKVWQGRRERSVSRRRLGPREVEPRWTLDVNGGRFENLVDPEKRMTFFRLVRAFVPGTDREHYFLREGVRVGIERATDTWRVGLAYRNHLEKPLATTTTWNLLRNEPSLIFNLPAAEGRAVETRADFGIRVPRYGVQTDAWIGVASEGLGSDFDYTRTRIAVGIERPLGRIASLLPQLEYGRLTGDAIPQASFYLGGSHSLRSFPTGSFGGTVKALGRLDLYFPQDLLALARIPHPAMLPISLGLFAATGAVAGTDPYGGPAVEGEAWPDESAWKSEAGAALLWRPGIPSPIGFVRFDAAWRLGPGDGNRFSLEYSVPMDLLKAFE
jgi:hypothetical protein